MAIQTGRIHWEKEKLLVTSNFSFSHSVFNRLVSQGCQKVSLCGNGLSVELSWLYMSRTSCLILKLVHLDVCTLIRQHAEQRSWMPCSEGNITVDIKSNRLFIELFFQVYIASYL